MPRSCPWRLDQAAEQRILDARARTNYGPARLAGLVGYRRSTVWKVLARHGVARRRRSPRERAFRRYEWAQPGALLHMDTKRLQRFHTPGHWATGDRTEIARNRGAGYVYAHCVVDDRSRLAYVELHSTDTGNAAAVTLRRAAAWMREEGAGPTEAVMTDNAFDSHAFAAVLGELGARHIRTPPVRNGREGRRFGGGKLPAELDGSPLLEYALAGVERAPLDRTVVVLGADADDILARVPLHGAEPVVCEDWEEGQSASLRCGAEELAGAEAVVVTLGDQPRLSPEAIERVIAARTPQAQAIRATDGGAPGHPVLLERRLLGRIHVLHGDTGAADIDTPEDLEALR